MEDQRKIMEYQQNALWSLQKMKRAIRRNGKVLEEEKEAVQYIVTAKTLVSGMHDMIEAIITERSQDSSSSGQLSDLEILLKDQDEVYNSQKNININQPIERMADDTLALDKVIEDVREAMKNQKKAIGSTWLSPELEDSIESERIQGNATEPTFLKVGYFYCSDRGLKSYRNVTKLEQLCTATSECTGYDYNGYHGYICKQATYPGVSEICCSYNLYFQQEYLPQDLEKLMEDQRKVFEYQQNALWSLQKMKRAKLREATENTDENKTVLVEHEEAKKYINKANTLISGMHVMIWALIRQRSQESSSLGQPSDLEKVLEDQDEVYISQEKINIENPNDLDKVIEVLREAMKNQANAIGSTWLSVSLTNQRRKTTPASTSKPPLEPTKLEDSESENEGKMPRRKRKKTLLEKLISGISSNNP